MINLKDKVVYIQHIKSVIQISLSVPDTLLTDRERDTSNQIHFHNNFTVLFQNKGSCSAR